MGKTSVLQKKQGGFDKSLLGLIMPLALDNNLDYVVVNLHKL